MYNVVITHPDKDAGLVSVRSIPAVSEKRGEIRNGETFEADLDFRPSGDVWCQITKYDKNPSFVGLYCALKYGKNTFATWRELTPIPSTGIRGYVYRNHEKQFFEFYKGNIPDTRPIFGEYVKNNGGIVYTKHLQYWLYNELQSRVPEVTIVKFKKDFEYWLDDDLAFFNFAGSETRRVYPLGLNLKSKDPHAQQIICGGMTLQLLDDKPKWIRTLKKYCYPISCINAQDKNIEDYNSFDYPHLWYRPAIQYGHTVARQEPFSQFNGKGRMPILANGTNVAWIYADLVRVLGKDEVTPPQFTLDWGS